MTICNIGLSGDIRLLLLIVVDVVVKVLKEVRIGILATSACRSSNRLVLIQRRNLLLQSLVLLIAERRINRSV